jgi:RimJ/RimL family protein N-acetyltransferase
MTKKDCRLVDESIADKPIDAVCEDMPLRGKRILLAPLKPEDMVAIAPFFADTNALYHYLPDKLMPRNDEQLRVLMEDWNDGERNLVFACRYDGKTIGIVSISDIDFVSGNGELGVMISNVNVRGMGLATEACMLMLDYAFGELRLHRVTVRVAPGNEPPLQLFRKLGFIHEGRMREVIRRRDSYGDLLLFGLLEDEYRIVRDETPLSVLE